VRYLNRLFDRRSGVPAVGFKLMYLQASAHTGIVPYLAARRARAVHLVRANALDQIVSYEAALARNVFRARRGDVVPGVTVRLDASALPARLESMESEVAQARRMLARYRLKVLEVVYEDLAEATGDELTRVVSFLDVGLTDWEAESSLVGANRVPRDDLIENLSDVEAALAGTGTSGCSGRGQLTDSARDRARGGAAGSPGGLRRTRRRTGAGAPERGR